MFGLEKDKPTLDLVEDHTGEHHEQKEPDLEYPGKFFCPIKLYYEFLYFNTIYKRI
tara:strand:+ start:639 stop:806 length:168 start_codon:yes stop_codon:yes gene_type:complete